MLYFLIGLPGCGKSYWGQQLAARYSLPYLDLDQQIEEVQQKSISDIFQEEGEAYFRQLESETLQNLITHHENAIIACGGGTPCFFDNMEMMNKAGITIFVNPPPARISAQLKNDQELEKRPLFKGLHSSDQVQNHLEKLLNQRITAYKKARHEVVPGNLKNTLKAFNTIIKS